MPPLPLPGRPRALLAIHHDGFSVQLAWLRPAGRGHALLASARSDAIELADALAEGVERLRSGARARLPRRAVLITATAFAALLRLPVAADRPRPAAQMAELARWDLEPLFAQQAQRWSLGALLMGRGHLDAGARAEAARAVHEHDASSTARMTVRFGEAAEQLGHVERPAVEVCLALQERLVRVDDELVCACVAQAPHDDPEPPQEGEGAGGLWLACGMAQALRREWLRACERSGLDLVAIHPSLGTGFGALAHERGRDTLYLDVEQEEFALVRGRTRGLAAYRVERIADGMLDETALVEACREELRPSVGRVVVNAAPALAARLRATLAPALRREVEVATPGGGTTPGADAIAPGALLALRAAAARAARARTPGVVATLGLPRTRAAPWRRRELLPHAIGASLLLLVAGTESYLRLATWRSEARLAALDQRYEERLALKTQAESTLAEVRALEAELEHTRAQVDELEGEVERMQALIARRRDVRALLETLEQSVDDEVLISRLEHDPRAEVVFVGGWALTSTAAQGFVSRLARGLRPLGLELRDSRVAAGDGRLAAPGYELSARIVPEAGS